MRDIFARKRVCLLSQTVTRNIFLILRDLVIPPLEKIFCMGAILTTKLDGGKPTCFQHTVDRKTRGLEQLCDIADCQKCAIFGRVVGFIEVTTQHVSIIARYHRGRYILPSSNMVFSFGKQA